MAYSVWGWGESKEIITNRRVNQ